MIDFAFLPIAHRGNLWGPMPALENKPSYLQHAIDKGFDIEADIWLSHGKFFLGHDGPQYAIERQWLEDRASYLWLHCKNFEALVELQDSFHCFWQDGDAYSLTSRGVIWANIGQLVAENCALVALSRPNQAMREQWLAQGCTMICTDYAAELNEQQADCYDGFIPATSQ